MKKMFNLIDADGSGRIERDELRVAIERLGLAATQKDLEETETSMDEDGDGTIDFKEFCNALESAAEDFDMTAADFCSTLLNQLQPQTASVPKPQASSAVSSQTPKTGNDDMFIPIFVGVAAGGYSLILAWEWFRLNFLEK